jgi:hypothetical protein
MTEQERRDWHRMFGALLRDHLSDQPLTVETEVDVSLQQQLLDVVIIRRGAEPLTVELPDGFEDLAAYNLISFKSHQEVLDAEAMDELVSHFIRYRQQVSPRARVLPLDDFRLFALSARYPREFARGRNLRQVRPGVYAISSFSKEIRIVVVHELPQEGRNVTLHLFSAKGDALDFARRHYEVQSHRPSALLAQLLGRYKVEGVEMPFDVEKYLQQLEEEAGRQAIAKMTPEQRVEGLTPEQRLEGLPPEQRLAGLPLQDQIKALSPEALAEIRRQLAAEKPADPK